MCSIRDFKLEKFDYGHVYENNVSIIRNWADGVHSEYGLNSSKHCAANCTYSDYPRA